MNERGEGNKRHRRRSRENGGFGRRHEIGRRRRRRRAVREKRRKRRSGRKRRREGNGRRSGIKRRFGDTISILNETIAERKSRLLKARNVVSEMIKSTSFLEKSIGTLSDTCCGLIGCLEIAL